MASRFSSGNSSEQGDSLFPVGQWWIDDTGDMHDHRNMDNSFDEIFISHLGQIRVETTPNHLALSWDTRKVDGTAVQNIVNRLRISQFRGTVSLNFIYFGWVEEFYPNCAGAVERILEIQAHKDIDVFDTTMMTEQPLDKLNSASPLIQSGYGHWSKSEGNMAKLPNEAVANYFPHLVMFRHDPYDNKLIYFWVGNNSSCAKVYGDNWAKSAIGTDAARSSGPESKAFADRISTQFYQVLDTGVPQYHHVRTLMGNGKASPKWQSYERLVVRHTLGGGGVAISVLSNLTQDLSISLAGHP